jgi:hypothetical protein
MLPQVAQFYSHNALKLSARSLIQRGVIKSCQETYVLINVVS